MKAFFQRLGLTVSIAAVPLGFFLAIVYGGKYALYAGCGVCGMVALLCCWIAAGALLGLLRSK